MSFRIFVLTLYLVGLRQDRYVERQASIATKFMSDNATEAAQAWDKIEAGHGLVAVDRQWATNQGLPSTLGKGCLCH